MHIALPCVKIVDYLSSSICVWRDSNPLPLYNRQGNLAVVCPSRTVYFPPQSDPPFMRKYRNNEISIHVAPKPVKGGVTVAYPNRLSPSMVAVSPQSLSRIRPLVWPAAWTRDILQGFARSHVSRVKCSQSALHWRHRLSAVPARRTTIRPSRAAQPFRLQR